MMKRRVQEKRKSARKKDEKRDSGREADNTSQDKTARAFWSGKMACIFRSKKGELGFPTAHRGVRGD